MQNSVLRRFLSTSRLTIDAIITQRASLKGPAWTSIPSHRPLKEAIDIMLQHDITSLIITQKMKKDQGILENEEIKMENTMLEMEESIGNDKKSLNDVKETLDVMKTDGDGGTGDVVGMVTERDFIMKLTSEMNILEEPISSLMTRKVMGIQTCVRDIEYENHLQITI